MANNNYYVEVTYDPVDPRTSLQTLNNSVNDFIKGKTPESKKVSTATLKEFKKQVKKNTRKLRYKLGENSEMFLDFDAFSFYGYMNDNGATILQSIYNGEFEVGISDMEYGYNSKDPSSRVGPQNFIRPAIQETGKFYIKKAEEAIYKDYMTRIYSYTPITTPVNSMPNYSRTYGDKYV